MQVLGSLESLRDQPIVMGLGTFDGLHLGHRELARSIVEYGKEYQFQTMILTFKENPFKRIFQLHQHVVLTDWKENFFFLIKLELIMFIFQGKKIFF